MMCLPHSHRIVAVATLLLVLLGQLACKPTESRPVPSTGSPETSGQSSGIDALRANPYADGAPVGKDEFSGAKTYNIDKVCPGYRLYTIQARSRAELIDNDGNAINTWSYEPSEKWEHAELLADGDLLVVGHTHGAMPDGTPMQHGIADDSRYLLRLDWDSEVIWKRALRAHHDVEVTPDGKILLLTFQRRQVADIHPDIPLRDDELTLIDPDAKTIESHSMYEAVRRSRGVMLMQPVKPSRLGGPPWVDLFHANSVEWMSQPDLAKRDPLFALDNILVCFRHQDRVAVFNWPDNKVVWSWGYKELDGPHDAQVLDDGHVLVFDNGLARGWSRGVEMDPLTGKIVWQYKAAPPESFYTASKGSIQRLPNGNTLMAESDKGRAVEVTLDGTMVWEFRCPYTFKDTAGDLRRAAIVRMKHFSPEFVKQVHKHVGG